VREYDVVVIGSGAGLNIVEGALSHGLSVALIDKGPVGGTCLNLGCIPSKMLIYPADRAMDVADARKLGVKAEVRSIDFGSIMERMHRTVSRGASHVREGVTHFEGLDFFEGLGHFAGDYTLDVKGQRIKGKRLFIASGARPTIPPIKGLDSAGFLTNESVLQLKEKPEDLIIVGGGYIAAEYAHFFAAMGTRVTLVQRNARLLPEEEPEISELLKSEMGKRMEIHTNTEVVEVEESGSGYKVKGIEKAGGKERLLTAGKIMIASGRTSNADLLKVEKTGIKTDDRGYIVVNEYLETGKKNIWAFGDAIGKKMFRHVANRESRVAWNNAEHGAKEKMDYLAAPHAVFSYPEIASVGLTEDFARRRYSSRDLLVGRAKYTEVARGEAMMEEKSFAKAIVQKGSGKILGFHIIGAQASTLIQEVVMAMANNLDIWALAKGMHIHPALPELIIATLGNLEELQ
jgi:mycothione reductase